ncbi:MAG: glycosyltransferase family 2 protein [Lachnospiraceae bacterium]|nr:glycosyltransferase family 2 protein [Lachnospiraceae bacterium]
MKDYEVIIPVYEPDKRLYIILKRLLKQSVKPQKINIILTLSEKYGALEFMEGLAVNEIKSEIIGVETIEKQDFNHGGSRQSAAEKVRSGYVLFMTQDAVPYDRKLAEKLLDEFDNERTAVAYARQMPYKNATLREKFARSYNYPDVSQVKDKKMLDEGKIKAIFCSDVCAMYDMNVFNELNGFERNTDFNEDMLYANKALLNGYLISYCADAKVYHSHNLTFTGQFKRNKEIARSQKEHPEVFEPLSSENEGLSFVKNGVKYMMKEGSIKDTAAFIADCGFKFAGYKIGKIL